MTANNDWQELTRLDRFNRSMQIFLGLKTIQNIILFLPQEQEFLPNISVLNLIQTELDRIKAWVMSRGKE